MNKAVFLDRDGTINKEVNYLYKTSDFEFIDGVPEAIKIFHELGYLVIVITNQAGIARGYYTEKDVNNLHKFIDEKLKQYNTFIDEYYYCPHHPDGVIQEYSQRCHCRKPETGMIEKAITNFKNKGIEISLKDSIFVGDKEIDVQTGKNAEIGLNILVKTGHQIDENQTVADKICNDLLTFASKLKIK